ncbi:MAG: hypothetical protein NTV36_01930 [Candidatus Staskawiczbacteria bacterium]|nr:hypothetical protein [Candidatus Staskawiczbacteria bacterium]
MNTSLPFIKGEFSFQPGNTIQISIVAYGHSMGMPARFCTGLIPAIQLSRKLEENEFKSVIRVVDPSPIANHCNGWKQEKQPQFCAVISRFFNQGGTNFFFDTAEQVTSGALEILNALGSELESSVDDNITDMVKRIKESGRRHGGESGAKNSTLYMAAHPFSWLDMYHPLIWKKTYPSEDFQFTNLMSRSEERFAIVRRFLQARRPDLCTANNPVDLYTTTCDTPCYIPLEEEPMLPDLTDHGYDWCWNRYKAIKGKSSNHKRALKDFEVLMSFLGWRAS